MATRPTDPIRLVAAQNGGENFYVPTETGISGEWGQETLTSFANRNIFLGPVPTDGGYKLLLIIDTWSTYGANKHENIKQGRGERGKGKKQAANEKCYTYYTYNFNRFNRV
jgi:hypothetical protein